MAYLDNNTTLSKTLTLNKASGTVVTLNTGNTYLNKNIELTLNIQNENPSFSGGDITGTATASSNSCSISSSTNNSGIELIAAASASRSAINYNKAVSGWVEKANGAVALAAQNNTNLTSTTYYLNGVTLTAPNSGTNTFTVTVPNETDNPLVVNFIVLHTGEIYIDGSEEIDELVQANGVIF